MFFKIKKLLVIILFLFLVPMIFISCDNIKLSSDVKIKFNGDIYTTVRLNYDETVSSLVGNNLLSIILGDTAKDFSIKKYTDDNRYIEEIDINTNIIKFNSNKDKNNTIINKTPSNFFDYNITSQNGLFVNTYIFKLSLNENIMDIIKESIKTGLNNNLNVYLNPSISSLISSGVSTGISSYIRTLPYDLTIYTPVDIIDSNATEQIDSKTLKWTYILDDLNENTELIVSFKMPNIINISILAISALTLILIVIIFIIKKRMNTTNH